MNPIPASGVTPPAIQQLTRLLPDTSGLAPLNLPPELLSRIQSTPAPDAIRRFQTAIADPIPPPETATQAPPSTPLSPSPLHALPFAAPEQPALSPSLFPVSPTFPDSRTVRLSAAPVSPVSPDALVLPPPPDLAKKADLLARLLFSRFESIPYEIVERREVSIPLPPAILDSTAVVLTPKDDTLLVTLSPSTPSAAPLAAALLPYLSEALPLRLPASPHIQVVLTPVPVPAPATSTEAAAPVPPPLQAAPVSAPVPSEPLPAAPDSSTPPSPLRVSAPPREIPFPSAPSVITPPPQSAPTPDVAPLADLLVSRLATIPSAELELREIRLPLDSPLPPAVPSVSSVPVVSFSVQTGTLRVTLPSSVQFTASNLLPRLAEALETRLPAFSRVQVVLETLAATSPLAPESPAIPPSLRVSAPLREIPPPLSPSAASTPTPSVLPPPADLAPQSVPAPDVAPLADLLVSRLATIPPAELESREIRLSLDSSLPPAIPSVPSVPFVSSVPSVSFASQTGTLRVTLPFSAQFTAANLLPRLAEALETRLPAFSRVQVVLEPSAATPPMVPDALATPEFPSPDTSRVAVVPEYASRPDTREIPPSEILRPVSSPARPAQASDQEEPEPLQALPFAAPAPLEPLPLPSASRPQAPRPVVPAQPAAPAPEFSPAFSSVERPRQLDILPVQTAQTPAAPLQAVHFAASATLSPVSPSPASPPPSASLPPSSPAMPAEPSSSTNEILAHPAPPPQVSASQPDISQPATQPTIKPSNHQTIKPSLPPRDNSAPLQAAPVDIPAPAASPVPLADPAAVASAASARTATLAETANQIASAVAARILVTPSLAAGGDGEIHISLQPAVLDGSTVTLTARNGTLAVAVVPATAEAAALATAALPQLAAAMEAHAPAFRRVQVSLASKKGNPDETV